MISTRLSIPSFGAPLPGRTFDSEYVNQQVTTTTQVHSADFESATGVSLCTGPPSQSKWDDWQTTWCTADVLVEREQESGTSNNWLAVNSKYCTNGAMFTFYPVNETHTVTMDISFGTATSVNVLLFWRCPGGSGTWNNSSFMTNVSGTTGTTSPVSFTFNPSTLSPPASGCEVMIMLRKNSCATTVETFYVDHVNVSYQSTSTQAGLVKSGYRYGFNGQEKDNEVMGEGNSYTAEFWNYDARLGRRWNVDPKPSPANSSYAVFSNNPVYYVDPQGDTITINLLSKTKDRRAYDRANRLIKERDNDGVFVVFAHGTSRSVSYYDDQGNKRKAETSEDYIKALSQKCPEFSDALMEGKKVCLIMMSCNSASENYVSRHNSNVEINTPYTIAEKIADGLPKGSVVIAPDGYLRLGETHSGSVSFGVLQTSSTQPKNTEEGGFVVIMSGQRRIAKKKVSIGKGGGVSIGSIKRSGHE